MNKIALKDKAELLAQVILLTKELYDNPQTTPAQKGLLETIIGAGIWYLPSSTELYSGFISKKAYESLKIDPVGTKLVEEHSFPRKLAGETLYAESNYNKIKENIAHLEEVYREKFGKFNLVLKSENDKLKAFQKKGIFIDEEVAYKNAGLELLPFDIEKYKHFKSWKNSLRSKKTKVLPFEL